MDKETKQAFGELVAFAFIVFAIFAPPIYMMVTHKTWVQP